MGCVYKPAEEYEQEMGATSADESLAYGVISIVGLSGTEVCPNIKNLKIWSQARITRASFFASAVCRHL
jgi:hypothetical protein